MKDIPEGFVPYRRTPVFNSHTLPDGLRNRHTTKDGVWARIHVLSGKLMYRVHEASQPAEQTLRAGATAVIEPQIEHDVDFLEDGQFYVEFYAKQKR